MSYYDDDSVLGKIICFFFILFALLMFGMHMVLISLAI